MSVNCVLWSCDMNSTLGSVVPLAMFLNITDWVEAAWSITDLPPAAPGILLLLLLVNLGLLESSLFLQFLTIWTHLIMRGQATDHYYRECAILQLQIFGIWKSSPATPKTGVWLKPVLAVGNWSRPIISQSESEKKRVKCRSGRTTKMRKGAYTSEGFLLLLYWSFYQMEDTQPVHFLIMTT